MVNTVLLVDNDPNDVEELSGKFKAAGKIVLNAADDLEARKILENVGAVDVIVLDIYLNEKKPIKAKILLQYIVDHQIVPVFIYTNHPQERLEYPCILGTFSKVDDVEKITSEVSKKLGQARLITIGIAWSRAVHRAAHKTLLELMPKWSQDPQSYDHTLKVLLAGMRQDRRQPPEVCDPVAETRELISIFSQGISPKIIEDVELTSIVSAAIQAVGSAADISEEEDYWKFRDLLQYSRNSTKLTTGDILRSPSSEYFILISPQCDLVDPKEDMFFCVQAFPLDLFVKDEGVKKETRLQAIKNKVPKYHVLLAGNPELRLVVDFAHLSSLKRDLLETEYTRLATLSSPFRENLIQRYVSYVSRIGTPDIPDKILDSYFKSHT